jgi:MFS superfamily sulfate permease-like transporter
VKKSIQRVIHFILVIVLLATSLFTVFYYWTATSTTDLRSLPTSLLTIIIFYIIAQLIKRYVKQATKWYDWVYYLGLIAILLPLPLFSSEGEWIFSTTKYGSLLLFIPPLIELFELLLSKKKA